jgi:transposase-like protein
LGDLVESRKFRQFIEQAATLTLRQRTDLAACLNSTSLREQTCALIETTWRQACPHCGSRRLQRHGQAHGLQRHRCVACARSCSALTGTPLAGLRHRGKWLTYLDSMLHSNTVRRAAALAGVHKNTSFRWRHRFLMQARHDRVGPLSGITEADETYLLESQKESRNMDRQPRRRGGSARRRGFSREHDCILVARDRSGRTVDFVTGRAPLRHAHLQRCLRPAVDSAILLVTDGHAAYRVFARVSGIAHHALNPVGRGAGGRRAARAKRQRLSQPVQAMAAWSGNAWTMPE